MHASSCVSADRWYSLGMLVTEACVGLRVRDLFGVFTAPLCEY